MRFRRSSFRFVRRVHLYLGLGAALYFMLIAATGVALNHRQGFHLEDRYLSRQWLPSSYRPQDGEEVRSDIVIGDLHSGLIFGRVGAPVMDVVAVVWVLSLLSGLSLAVLGRSLHNGHSVASEDVEEEEPLARPVGSGRR
jgi:uncharacterized iron-regulated membrane protein